MTQRFTLFALLAIACGGTCAQAAGGSQPNILWLTSEDHGPHLGCYGDRLATTPNVDALAARGVLYRHCWSNAPVCAPARTTLVSGLYASSTGAEHMRSMVAYPRGKQMYPQFLREAGYYCTNNAKEDYNLAKPGKVWDESSKKAHWKNRPSGQPFFAVFNCEKSHESKLRIRPHEQIHDPAKVRVPAYHPDTPEVRLDWAQYYDTVTEADAAAGERLKELEQAGLAADTIVFYFADHGSGMPGNKRWPREAGLHVPLVIYIPERFAALRPPDYRTGGQVERLVSFVDFAPTLLSLAGIEPPDWMQGFAFLGKYAAPPQPFVYGFRGRMDERYDLVRCVTDGRYVYVRNFRPDKIYGQHLDYMWQTPTTRVWERLFQQGKLNAAQSAFWKTKPPEELYLLASDPDEVHNLAASPEHAEALERLRTALHAQMAGICDVGLLPEGDMHRRSGNRAPYDMGHDPAEYPFAAVYEMADLASSLRPDALPRLMQGLTHSDSAVRYWAVLGLLMRGPEAVATGRDGLLKALDDSSPDVRIAAAETLGRYGSAADLSRALSLLGNAADWSRNDVFTAIAAINALTALGDKAAPLAPTLAALPTQGVSPDRRYKDYVPRLLGSLRESLSSNRRAD
jgi:uncharacterized sulfatase